MNDIRRKLKKVLPTFIYQPLKKQLDEGRWRKLQSATSRAEIFSLIYKDKMWGGSDDFYSGHGSADPQLVEPYIAAVSAFLSDLPTAPDVCDFGCGDFRVGQKVRPLCAGYVGADVVPELIERNKERFADLNVDFRVVDIVTDDLPEGEVAFIREVLQHLSNAEIEAVLPKLAKFRYVVVTEDLPQGDFLANVDKPASFDIRATLGSGVDLEKAPFDFPVKSAKVICEVTYGSALLRTTVYEPA
jgi:hypothetical protein